MATNTEQVGNHAEDGEKSLCMPSRLEASHPPLAFSRRLMRVLSTIVQSPVAPVHGVRQQFSARGAVAGEVIGHNDAWRIPQAPQQLPEKSSRCLLASSLLDEDIENAAILIDCTPQILQATTDLDEHLIQMPRIAQLSPPSANAFGAVPTESLAPCPDRLVGHGDTALSHQYLDIAIADREPETHPHAVGDDLWWEAVTAVGRGMSVHRAIESEPAPT
jgi:hypothetical protein